MADYMASSSGSSVEEAAAAALGWGSAGLRGRAEVAATGAALVVVAVTAPNGDRPSKLAESKVGSRWTSTPVRGGCVSNQAQAPYAIAARASVHASHLRWSLRFSMWKIDARIGMGPVQVDR